MSWAFKKLKLEILKIKDLKTTNKDCKKTYVPKKVVDTVQLYQLNVSSTWHTVQLTFVTGSGKIDHVGTRIKIPLIA